MPHSFPASKQVPLAVGERLCDLAFLDPKGQPFSLYDHHLYGWPKAIFLANSAAGEAAELTLFAGLLRDLGQAETHLLAVVRSAPAENAAVIDRLGLSYPVLCDPTGMLHQAAGLDAAGPSRTLLFDPVLRLERIVMTTAATSQAEAAITHVRNRAARFPPVVVNAQAPVLVVPNVLDPEHCRRLIEFWRTGQKRDNTVAGSGDRLSRVNPNTKIRSDVIVPDGSPESLELVGAISRRLLPEVLKAFNYRVSRMENYRIGCYDADAGGHFAAHRDNTTPLTAHRRYALVVNLNTGDYEGGYLRLPEYGPQLYAPPSGGAVVFSCSLLHMVYRVSRGRRFMIAGFFWGEEEQQRLEKTLADHSAMQEE